MERFDHEKDQPYQILLALVRNSFSLSYEVVVTQSSSQNSLAEQIKIDLEAL